MSEKKIVRPVAAFVAAAIGWGATTALAQQEASSAAKADEDAEPRLNEVVVFGRGNALTLNEVPQTVDVYQADFIEDINAVELNDVLRFVPNLLSLTTGAIPTYVNNYRSRGFAFSNVVYNGLVSVSHFSAVPNTANVERVEVLKGPSSVLFGSMEPAAVINIVTKTPQKEFEAETALRFGSFDHKLATVDIGGPISDRIGARLNVSYLDTESPIELTKVKELFVGPVVQFDFTDNTRLFIDATYQKREWPLGQGDGRLPRTGGMTPHPAGKIPWSRNYQHVDQVVGPAGFDHTHWTQTEISAVARLHHKVGGALSFNAAVGTHRGESDWVWVGFPVGGAEGVLGPDRRLLTRNADLRDSEPAESNTVHVDAQGEFETGALHHAVMTGFDYKDYSFDYRAFVSNSSVVPAIDLFNPVYGTLTLPDPLPLNRFLGGTTTSEIYVQDRMKLGDWHFLVGARYTDFESETDNRNFNGTRSGTLLEDKIWTTQAGILYDLTETTTVYVSRNESFVPQTVNFFPGNQTPLPTEGVQYEAGVKVDLGRSFSASIAYFDIEKSNVRINDVFHPGFQTVSGLVESKGVEVSIQGAPAPGLKLYASAGYNPTKIIVADVGQGNEFGSNMPKHTFSAFSSYELQSGTLRGLSITGSLEYIGEMWESNLNTWKTPAYTRVDIGANYPFNDHLELGFNINNLMGSEFFQSWGGDLIRREKSRTFYGKLTYRF